ncbi:heme-binding domain-containing protein [uncultured Psychroserpens sp.]|uniref:heme-binding domain-containing protein n=1 Tax=uncultured Psychroserpens sp. TaxID=255436 RepID=UPI0026197627|nr:heme-binding domain-containing protein [uncultured Psychroserpens sp.]
MKIIKKILVVLLIAFIIMQFFGPDKNEGDLTSINAFIADTNPPNDVHEILKNACFDCHSDVTRYPWYNKITPINYWMADHIDHGKGHFDVSSWEGYSLKKKDHKMDELIEMVEAKEMPLPSYTWTHGDAKLSEAQIKAIVDWGKAVRAKYSEQMQP